MILHQYTLVLVSVTHPFIYREKSRESSFNLFRLSLQCIKNKRLARLASVKLFRKGKAFEVFLCRGKTFLPNFLFRNVRYITKLSVERSNIYDFIYLIQMSCVAYTGKSF